MVSLEEPELLPELVLPLESLGLVDEPETPLLPEVLRFECLWVRVVSLVWLPSLPMALSAADDVAARATNHRLADVMRSTGERAARPFAVRDLQGPIDGARAAAAIFRGVRAQRTVETIRRARLGDTSATRALVDEAQEPIVELAKVCVALGWPLVDVLEAFAGAVAVAIETFDQDSPRSFADHTLDCLVRAIHVAESVSAAAPN